MGLLGAFCQGSGQFAKPVQCRTASRGTRERITQNYLISDYPIKVDTANRQKRSAFAL
jgi:hypothetical protein